MKPSASSRSTRRAKPPTVASLTSPASTSASFKPTSGCPMKSYSRVSASPFKCLSKISRAAPSRASVATSAARASTTAAKCDAMAARFAAPARVTPTSRDYKPSLSRRAKIDVHIIDDSLTGVIHFLQAPVAAIVGDAKGHLAFAFARLAVVVVFDLDDDRAVEAELFGVNARNDAINLHIICIAAPALFARDGQGAIGFGDRRAAEIIPAYPLQRKPMLAEQHLFRGLIIDDRLRMIGSGLLPCDGRIAYRQ